MRGVTKLNGAEVLSAFTFQLTRLMRGVTAGSQAWRRISRFQLTRLMRGVTDLGRTLAALASFQLTRLMRGVT